MRFAEVAKLNLGGETAPLLRGPFPGAFAHSEAKGFSFDTAGWDDLVAEKDAAGQIAGMKFDFDERTIPFTASQQTEDRQGDLVHIPGLDLKDFKANPVLMPFHRYDEPPLGTVPRAVRKAGELKALAKFSKVEGHDMANLLFGMMWEREVRGFSIGFIERVTKLRKIEKNEDDERENTILKFPGRLFQKALLLEISVASIPAHANALAGKNVDDAEYLVSRLAEAIIGQNQDTVDKDGAGRIIRLLVSELQKAAVEVEPDPPSQDPSEPDVPVVTKGEPAPVTPEQKQMTDEVANAAADYALSRISL